MKRKFHCSLCWPGTPGSPNFLKGKPSLPIKLDIEDSGVYNVYCSNKHHIIYIEQASRFEVLFRAALEAILDSNYRDAVLAFASSLERFYEFYVSVICFSKSINYDEYLIFKKAVSKQSEREFGAFLLMFLLENRTACRNIGNVKMSNDKKQSYAEFRNSVAHQGVFPNRKDTILFGDIMIQHAQPILQNIKHLYPEDIRNSLNEEQNIRSSVFNELKSKNPGATIITTATANTFSAVSYTNTPSTSVAEMLESLAKSHLRQS